MKVLTMQQFTRPFALEHWSHSSSTMQFTSLLIVCSLLALPILVQPASAQAISGQKDQKVLAKQHTAATRAFEPIYQQLRQEFNADNSFATVAFVEKYWRIAGNTGFNESIYHVEKILQQAGFKKEEKGESDATLTYRIESRKMKRPTWEPVAARVDIVGDAQVLLESSSNRNMLIVNSASTPSAGSEAEVVYVGKASAAELEAKDIKDKIVFAEAPAAMFYKQAVARGALGVISYSMPAYTQPQKYTNSIQFQNLPYLDAKRQIWALAVSYQAKERLKSALEKGNTKLRVLVNTKHYEADELTLVANVRGKTASDQRFVFSAHVQEPGANDNATGVGTLAEMARVTARLVQDKKWSPERTMTFIWGDEINSTQRYISENPERAKGIMWGLSLDMVGEDISKTGGSFLIEKMPDPSAIWTRGNDKHTEWGGSVLKESDMMPNYFTDFLINRCRQQGLENGWVVNANPYEGGSDHTPFLQAKIPGLLMWHFTDAFYHTDLDRLDKVSKDEMRNVGISALAAAYILANGDEQSVLSVIEEIKTNALARLQTEFDLSTQVVKAGGAADKEKHIIVVWSDWYVQALAKINSLPLRSSNAELSPSHKIKQAQHEIAAFATSLAARF